MEGLSLYFIGIQALGLIGYLFYSISSYSKNYNVIARNESIGCAMISAHQLMLGSVIASIINILYLILALLMRLGGFRHGPHYLPSLAIIFLALIAASFFSWTGAVSDYLAFMATTVFIISRAFKSDMVFRSLAIVSMMLWFGFNLSVGSVPGLIFNVIYIHGHADKLGLYAAMLEKVQPLKELFAKKEVILKS
ncbi:MAG: hypothetical protein CMH30_00630 [Micavibrio sp.]|nr:hypothetical protein [Micavibrio sp.]|tara:strand:+ start:1828 stop:2409 length:582 start_codon:yes stop_codon:yes gene_type:complete